MMRHRHRPVPVPVRRATDSSGVADRGQACQGARGSRDQNRAGRHQGIYSRLHLPQVSSEPLSASFPPSSSTSISIKLSSVIGCIRVRGCFAWQLLTSVAYLSSLPSSSVILTPHQCPTSLFLASQCPIPLQCTAPVYFSRALTTLVITSASRSHCSSLSCFPPSTVVGCANTAVYLNASTYPSPPTL